MLQVLHPCGSGKIAVPQGGWRTARGPGSRAHRRAAELGAKVHVRKANAPRTSRHNEDRVCAKLCRERDQRFLPVRDDRSGRLRESPPVRLRGGPRRPVVGKIDSTTDKLYRRTPDNSAVSNTNIRTLITRPTMHVVSRQGDCAVPAGLVPGLRAVLELGGDSLPAGLAASGEWRS